MGPCIYCLTTQGTPSVEHVFPRALGPHADVVLPAEAVCRACNNWLGKQVDEPLVQRFEIQLIRGLWQVPNRRGRRLRQIDLKDDDTALTFDQSGGLQLHKYVPAGTELVSPQPGETITETLTAARGGMSSQRRRTRRALLRIGLGLLHVSDKHDALHPDFDLARMVLLGAANEGLLFERISEISEAPDLNGRIRYDVPGSRMAIEFAYGPFAALTSLEVLRRPDLDEIDAWAQAERWTRCDIAHVAEPPQASEALKRLIAKDRVKSRLRPLDEME